MPDTPTRLSLLHRLGLLVARRPRRTIGAGTTALILAATIAAGAMDALSLSRFESPSSEAARAAEILERQHGTGSPNALLLVTAERGTVDSLEAAVAGRALTRALSFERGVAEVSSYWTGARELRADDGRSALVLARIPGSATVARNVLADLSPKYTREGAAVDVRVGGRDEVFRQAGEQAREDFVRAELIIFPLAFMLVLLFFRRVVAAALTLAVGTFAIVATLALLRVLAEVVEVSAFALNLALVMGLALGVDYSLLVVQRFRERDADGMPREIAIAETVATAGRTVVFSGVTVAASLLTLLLLPFPFLQSFAYAGVGVVLFAMLGAVVILPAALALLGDRVRRRGPAPTARFWPAAATRIVRRPALSAGLAVVLLLVLSTPVLGLRFGLPDERALPADASSRTVQEDIDRDFRTAEDDALQIVPAGPGRAPLDRYATDLAAIEGIARVDIRDGWLAAVPTTERFGDDPERLVRDVRAVSAPAAMLVGGYPADLLDFRTALIDRLPVVIGAALAVTFLVLFLMTGSVLIPAKATILNLLSLGVMFGALTWGFQDGNLADLLGFTPTGTLDPTFPILMFAIAYGLSMDYEVFMTSRIKEELDRTGDQTASIVAGIERSGPLVTAAAAILALSFAAYATSGIVYLQMLGVGMAVAVIADATVIRSVLLPAAMRLAGRANWWAPPMLHRLRRQIGLAEDPA